MTNDDNVVPPAAKKPDIPTQIKLSVGCIMMLIAVPLALFILIFTICASQPLNLHG